MIENRLLLIKILEFAVLSVVESNPCAVSTQLVRYALATLRMGDPGYQIQNGNRYAVDLDAGFVEVAILLWELAQTNLRYP